MKKHRTLKVISSISIVLIIIGSICLGAGFASGGSYKFLSINKDTATWWPFHGVGSGFSMDFDLDSGKTWSESIKYPLDLVVDANAGNIVIKKGNENSVKFQNYSKDEIEVTDVNSYTKITAKDSPSFTSKKKIIITLKNDKTSKLEIRSNAGKIEVNDLDLSKLDVSCDAGNIEMENVNVNENVMIEANAGNIDITDSVLKDMNINADAGNIEVDSILLGKHTISASAGNIELTLIGKKADYGYEVNSGMGKVEVDGEVKVGNSHMIVNEEAKNFVLLDCDLGNIRLSFANS